MEWGKGTQASFEALITSHLTVHFIIIISAFYIHYTYSMIRSKMKAREEAPLGHWLPVPGLLIFRLSLHLCDCEF